MSRLITPSKLSLSSRSPVIGAWWEDPETRGLLEGAKPEVSALDQQLSDDGLCHEQVLLSKLEAQGHRIARVPVKQSATAAAKAVMAEGSDFIHQAALRNDELGGGCGPAAPHSPNLSTWVRESHPDRVQALLQATPRLVDASPWLP